MKGKKLITTICIVCVLATLLCIPAFATVTESDGDGFALYNGVKLPDIDSVWTDEATYPYATLTRVDTAYILYLTNSQSSARSDGHPWFSAGTSFSQCVCTFDDSVAAEAGINTGEWVILGEGDFPQDGNLTDPVVWASYNILYSDGTIYLAASDPIPLDGYNVIEWDGDTVGLANVGGTYYKVSDLTPSVDYLTNCVVAVPGQALSGVSASMNGGVSTYDGIFYVAYSAGATVEGGTYTFPEAGVYFLKNGDTYVSLLGYRSTETPPDEGGGDDDDPQPPLGG